MTESKSEQPPVLPLPLARHITRQGELGAHERNVLRRTTAEWLAEGLLVFAPSEMLTPEQQDLSRKFYPSEKVLALGGVLLQQPEPSRDVILSAWYVDWLLFGKRLDGREVKDRAGAPRNETMLALGRRALYEAQHPGQPYVSYNSRHEEKILLACIACIVGRGAAEVGANVNVPEVRSCVGIRPTPAAKVFHRLSRVEQPLFAEGHQARNARNTAYMLTAAGMELRGEPVRHCDGVDLRPKKVPSPPPLRPPRTPRARKTAPVPVVAPAPPEKSRLGRFVAYYAADKSSELQQKMTDTLQHAVDEGLVVLRKPTSRYPKPHASAGHKREYIAIGPALQDELEAVQQAVVYSMGLSRMVYGVVPTPKALREQLGMLERDSLDAIVQLFWYRHYRDKQAKTGQHTPGG